MNLLTGATGLVGAHLLAQLILNKEKTRALFRTENKKIRQSRSFLSIDITPSKLKIQ